MEREIFEKEIEICRKQNIKNNGKCAWGECEKCGVIPLLVKLREGKVYENEEEIREFKRNILTK